jgi:hypothetical protein
MPLKRIPKVLRAEAIVRASELQNPNSRAVQPKPWGAWTLALLDTTTVCVVVRPWA